MTIQTPDFDHDPRTVSAEELAKLPHASPLSLEELLPILASPDGRKPLRRDTAANTLTDGERVYPSRAGKPLLLPARLHPYFDDRLRVPFDLGHDSFLQYFLLATIKQSGEINATATSVPYERHLARMKEFCASCSGRVLDVGCDNPHIGASLLSADSRYVGLDPFCGPSDAFRLVGSAEYLPFKDASLDAVVFNTSLDHVLDYHRAIDEAHRVLVPGGTLVIAATIAWLHSAELMNDAVHFHHFREVEITGALASFDVERSRRYDYKGDPHRYGLYVQARKRSK